MTRAELTALAETQIIVASMNLDMLTKALAEAGETLDIPEMITFIGVQARVATAAIDLARLK